ncbi:MAG: dehydratase [Chloroflexi bacterium]|nr:dehydratase [Chloroflexota bacterium]MBK7176683.1 dehydratase [Chloroflexota bacterium]MBP6803270.1 dehydratase [Chloroflexota bacterium]MBP7591645.1 dehydratase [Chloroflexota bacterium]
MTEFAYQPRGLYFEDFEIGQIMQTAARTITETDVVNFAGLSGDFNRIHTDAVYAAQDTFGQRVAHGLLVQSIATGLAVQSGIIEGTVIAFRELSCKFSLPVFFGDTIHVKIEITDTKAFRRLGGGNITMKYSVMNQDDKIVQRGDWVMLIKSKG